MPPARLLVSLSPDQRRAVEALVEKFERAWEGGGPVNLSSLLPAPDSPLRRPSLLGMIRAEMGRHWRAGRRPRAEAYLRLFPELGPDAAELALAEYQARRAAGQPADLDDLARRFPGHADELRRLAGEPAEADTSPDVVAEEKTTRVLGPAAPVPEALVDEGPAVGDLPQARIVAGAPAAPPSPVLATDEEPSVRLAVREVRRSDWRPGRGWRNGALVLLTAAAAVAAYLAADAHSRLRDVTAERDRVRAEAEQAPAVRAEDPGPKAEAEAARRSAAAEKERADRNLYAYDLTLALRDWQEGHVGRMAERLGPYRPRPGQADLRGWEWHHLWRLGHAELRTFTLMGGCSLLAFRRDGVRLFAAGSAYGLQEGDPATGEWLRPLPRPPGGRGTGAALTPDGKLLAVVGPDGAVQVCDDASAGGKQWRTLRAGARSRPPLAFSADGRWLASAADNRTLTVWDVAAGKVLHRLPDLEGAPSYAVAFSPDGRFLVSTLGRVKVWDRADGRLLHNLGAEGAYPDAAFSPDGQRLAAVTQNGSLRVWEPGPGRQVLGIEVPQREVVINGEYHLAFSPDGKRLASGGLEGAIRLHDAQSGKLQRTIKGHTHGLCRLAFSPDGRILASASYDSTIKLWDAGFDAEERALEGGPVFTGQLVFQADGRRLAAVSVHGRFGVWDAATGRQLAALATADAERQSVVAFCPHRGQLARGFPDGTVKLWETATGKELRTLRAHQGWVSHLAYSPDGARLASVGGDETVRIWDPDTGRELATLGGLGRANHSFAFSPDGRQLVSTTGGNALGVWDVQTGRAVRDLPARSRGRTLAFSPDGRRLARAVEGGPVHILDARTGRELLALPGHAATATCLAFSPDGTRLASGGEDSTLKLWDAEAGQELLTLRDPFGIRAVAFSPDGRRLAAAGLTIRVWDAGPLTSSLQVEREAVGLVESLAPDPLPKEELLARVRKAPAVTEAVRERALAWAESLDGGPDPGAPRLAPPADLAALYRAFVLANLRIADGLHRPGDSLSVLYDAVNVSDAALRVPKVHRLFGRLQHWVERLDGDGDIPAIPARTARSGRRYAAGGYSIAVPEVVAKGEHCRLWRLLDTRGYPPGRYRYVVEYRKESGDVLQTEQVDFELHPPGGPAAPKK